MNSKRLLAIASLIESDDIVVDVGCDHAYLDIYLIKNKLCKGAIATDVSKGALNQAITNINKYGLENDIKTVLSDGLKDVDFSFNTIVISGMGANTILEILNNPKSKNAKKIIIQSNNNLDFLRKEMQKRKYKIAKEIIVNENQKYYAIIKYVTGKQKLKINELLVGQYDSKYKSYYDYLYHKNLEILAKLPKCQINKALKLKFTNLLLKKYLKGS